MSAQLVTSRPMRSEVRTFAPLAWTLPLIHDAHGILTTTSYQSRAPLATVPARHQEGLVPMHSEYTPSFVPANVPNDFVTRFWSRVDQSGDCWVWTWGTSRAGYGRISLHGKPEYAHRLSWEMANGPIPVGMHVCHHCDNPPCVNPDHLFLGTTTDNMRDRDKKGRTARGDRSGARLHPERLRPPHMFGDDNPMRKHPELRARGERHGRARITEEDILKIRELHASGEVTYPQLAEMFGMSAHHISKIVRRKRWAHVQDANS